MGSHTYEISVDGKEWQGEVSFDSGDDISISTTQEVPETDIGSWNKMLTLFRQVGLVCAECGEIQKIEIVKK